MNLTQRDVAIALPSIFVLLAVAMGLVDPSPPLSSLRPSGDGIGLNFDRGIPARLWQDPVQVLKGAEGQDTPPVWPGVGELSQTVQGRLKSGERVQVLVAALPGSPYSESRENRLRTRYAILTGLSAEGFLPSSSESLGAFRVILPEGENSDRELNLPFEWFKSADEGSSRNGNLSILLIWLNEDKAGNGLLDFCHDLFHLLQPPAGRTEASASGNLNLTFDIIGPTNSSVLKRTAATATGQCQDSKCPAQQSSLFSPWSTADLPGLHTSMKLDWGFRFVPMIGTDRELCLLLAEELKLRGVKKGRGEIVMISEWDTVYGRQLPKTFQGSLHEVFGADVPDMSHMVYLRGIDGKRPGKAPSQQQSAKDDKQSFDWLTRSGGGEGVHWPEGESQYDYLRRLRQAIREFSEQGDGVQAIGVTGSDVHDKLLVLRALRERFPTALFFTTDLDVRLLHPSQRRWTHNLLVASHYGLAPNSDEASPSNFRQPEDLGNQRTGNAVVAEREAERPGMADNQATFETVQMEPLRRGPGRQRQDRLEPSAPEDSTSAPLTINFPHFRYSYQTALMLATAALLNDSYPTSRQTLSNPRIYELGRTTPQLLNSIARQPSTWPPQLLVAALLLLLTVPLLRPAGRRQPANVDLPSDTLKATAERAARFLGLTLLHSVPYLALTGIYLVDSRSATGEPPSWSQGVSLWPTLYLLLLLVMLASYFIKRIWQNFQHHLTAIERRCFPSLASSGDESGCRDTSPAGSDSGDSGPVQAWYLWCSFRNKTAPQRLGRRMALYLIVLLPASVAITLHLPRRPFRGQLTEELDLTLVFLAIFAIALVLALMLDVTYFSYHLVRCVGRNQTQWPSASEAPSAASETLLSIGREWRDINLIGQLTEFHNRFVYLPFILLLIYGLAHHYVFDNWIYRPLEWIEFLAAIALAWLPLIAVHLASLAARRDSLARLRQRHVEAWSDPQRTQETGSIEKAISDIQAIRIGAFARLTQNPILSTVLLPFGGIGGLILVESLLI